MSDRGSSFDYEQLLACARGDLFGPGNAQLPLPPLLMFDKISEISEDGGPDGKGFVRAEFEIRPDHWFFGCHFKNDPVMPGCLGLDALWQLLGFYLGWLGLPGRGRALGVGEVKFSDQVLPTVKRIVYGVDLKRVFPAQARARYRGWLAGGRRRPHIRCQGFEGRPVPGRAPSRPDDRGSEPAPRFFAAVIQAKRRAA